MYDSQWIMNYVPKILSAIYDLFCDKIPQKVIETDLHKHQVNIEQSLNRLVKDVFEKDNKFITEMR